MPDQKSENRHQWLSLSLNVGAICILEGMYAIEWDTLGDSEQRAVIMVMMFLMWFSLMMRSR